MGNDSSPHFLYLSDGVLAILFHRMGILVILLVHLLLVVVYGINEKNQKLNLNDNGSLMYI